MTGCADRRVLIAVPPEFRRQFFRAAALEQLAARARVTVLDRSALPASDAEIVITSWGVPRLTAAVLDALPELRLIAHTGATVKPFVTDEVFRRGIAVTQAGAAMARSVAEVALTFTLALLHQVPRYDRAMQDGGWLSDSAAYPQHEIAGCRIGVIGASRTGRAYLGLARALGAEIAVCDPFLAASEAEQLGVTRMELAELLATSRIVCLHAPSLPETRHLLGAAELALLPDGAGLVNTARAALVDEAALLTELRRGRLSAALDVFDAEPLPAEHPLRTLPNVLLTPHRAAGTVEGRARQGDLIVEEVLRHLAGERLAHAVTPADLPRMG